MKKTRWTAAELLRTKFQVNAEEEYRRGYCDGWIECVNAIEDAIRKRMTWAEALEWAWQTWTGKLQDWAHGDCSTEVLPPTSGMAGGERWG